MVRAGVVKHPSEWTFSGFNEIQNPRRKCVLIAYEKLKELAGFKNYEEFRASHWEWIEASLNDGANTRDQRWTESIAVGSKGFIKNMKSLLGTRC